MKILHVLDHSVPLQSGYAFRTLEILRQQRERGWQTCHLTSPKQGLLAADEEQAEGLLFHRTRAAGNLLGRIPGLWPLGQIRATAARLARIAAHERPTVLHAHSPALNGWAALRVGRALELPVVYEVRAFWEDAAVDLGTARQSGLRYRLTRALETSVLFRADAITTICEGLRRDIVARGVPAERITVIPNAVDVERFPPIERRDPRLESELGLEGTEVVGFCGSFYAYEGLELLVRAMPAIAAARPRARLLLVGGGPREPALRELVSRLSLGDRVTFTGRVPNAVVDRYYSLIDVLAYPRHRIRLTDLVTPLKPLEAMAQGRLVVASDIGGHRELIEHERTGLLFAPDDPAAVAAAVVRALSEPQLAASIRARARRFVEAERNWAASVARYEEVYAAAIAHRRGRRP